MPFDPVAYILAKRIIKNATDKVTICCEGGKLTLCNGAVDYSKIAELETATFTKLITLDANKNNYFTLYHVFRNHKDVIVQYKYYWHSKGAYGPRLGLSVRCNDTYDTRYFFGHVSGEVGGPHKIKKFVNGSASDLATGLGSSEGTGKWYFNDANQIIGTTLTFVDNGTTIGSVTDSDIASGNNIYFATWDSGNVVSIKDIIVKRASSYEPEPEKHVFLRVPKVIIKYGQEESYSNPLTALSQILLGYPIPVVTVVDLGKEYIVAVHEGIVGDLVTVLEQISENKVLELLKQRNVKVDKENIYKQFYGWNDCVDKKPITQDDSKLLAKELKELLSVKAKIYKHKELGEISIHVV